MDESWEAKRIPYPEGANPPPSLGGFNPKAGGGLTSSARPGGRPARLAPLDRFFSGSCPNSPIEDLRAAAVVARGRKVAAHVRAMVVPGSGLVRDQAEAEGLDQILNAAGVDWREPGRSMLSPLPN